MTAAEISIQYDTERTTREAVTDRAAAAWLAAHPEVKVTEVNLSKTLQQLFTELFKTGGRRQREPLSAHAESVLEAIGVPPGQFAPARAFTKSEELPGQYGAMFGRLAEALAALAAAVQLARIPVTNAAAKLVGPGDGIERRQLRGFVVGLVRPHAQKVLARVGCGASAEAYLQEILADVGMLAAAVVDAGKRKNARPTVLSERGAQQFARYAHEHLQALRGFAAARYGEHADDIVGAAIVKLCKAFRTYPDLNIGFAYGRQVIINAANDYFLALNEQRAWETSSPEDLERCAGTTDDEDVAVAAPDAVVRMVLAAAATLDDGSAAGSEAGLARQTLLRYFLADPAEADPRRARLAEHALNVMAAQDESDGFRAELEAIAGTLSPDGAATEHIITLAVTALRAQVRGFRNVELATEKAHLH